MTAYRFSVKLDRARNVVFLTQEGQPSADDFRKLMKRYENALQQLEPGPTVVNDQRHLEAFDAEAAEVAAELVSLTNRAGVSRLIRIVPESLLSQANVTRSLVVGRSRYENVQVHDMDEVEALLSGD